MPAVTPSMPQHHYTSAKNHGGQGMSSDIKRNDKDRALAREEPPYSYSCALLRFYSLLLYSYRNATSGSTLIALRAGK